MATTKQNFGKIDVTFLSSALKMLNWRKNSFLQFSCYFKRVAETDNGTGLYIVLGWRDGFEPAMPNTPNADKTWRICAKIAYKHARTMNDYDYSFWNMPYYPNGEAEDTDMEVEATAEDVKALQIEVDRLNKDAWEVWQAWKNKLDSLD